MQNIFTSLANEIAPLVGLKQGDQKLYLVGGVVRDLCLGKEHKDIDILCNFDTRMIARKFANLNHGSYFMLDDHRNTARVILNETCGRKIYDFARLRNADLHDDLSMRDFTINAMAIDLENLDEIIDPLNGRGDLGSHILRNCSDKSFSADPVRVLRAVRYSISNDLRIEDGTMDRLLASIDALDKVSGERKRDELFKIIESPQPAKSFAMLAKLGVLENLGFPVSLDPDAIEERTNEMDSLLQNLVLCGEGVKEKSYPASKFTQNSQDKLVDYLQARNSSDRTEMQLILLGCATDNLDENEVRKIAASLVLSREETENLLIISTNKSMEKILHSGTFPNDREMYHYFRATGEAGIDLALLALAAALPEGSNRDESERLHQAELCTGVIAYWFERPEVANPVLLLNGRDIMVNFDLTPGPLIGELIAQLREEQAAGMITNRQQALDWVENQLNRSSIQGPFDN